MKLRTWTAQDPEPDDHPDVADDLGYVWCWEDDSDTRPCACGEHVCTLGGSGWWSPSLGDGEVGPWSAIFTRHRPHGERAARVYELTPAQSLELCRELFS